MTRRRILASSALSVALGFVLGFIVMVVSAATAPTPERRPVGTMTAGPPAIRSIP